MIYENVFKALNSGRVKYVVVGGIALVLHGVVRFTADLDLMVKLDTKNLARFVAVMNNLGYRPRIPVKADEILDADKRELWKKEKGMWVFSFYDPKNLIGVIDIFIREPLKYEDVEEKKNIVKAGRIKIPIISKEYLIKIKRMSGRPQDLADIQALEEIRKLDKK